jgi:hypothetical protein
MQQRMAADHREAVAVVRLFRLFEGPIGVDPSSIPSASFRRVLLWPVADIGCEYWTDTAMTAP